MNLGNQILNTSDNLLALLEGSHEFDIAGNKKNLLSVNRSKFNG
jgi:hypothetical protein